MSESATQVLQPTQVRECVDCRALVDGDQSYCLKCGARQSGARTPPERLGTAEPLAAAAPAPLPGIVAPARDWTPFVALGGLAALALVLVIGVLIGRNGQSDGSKAAAAPQVITVQGGGAATPSSASAAGGTQAVGTISDDWPAGKSGWTVAVQTLPSGTSASTVASAKADAAAKGARNPGILDAGNYTGLGSGYVIYSGDYGSRASANAALGSVKKSFPGAKVIHVVPPGGGGDSAAAAAAATAATPPTAAQKQAGAQAIQQLNSCSGSACSKAARKVTKPIATPGAPPPTDNKAAGGGSGAQAFQ